MAHFPQVIELFASAERTTAVADSAGTAATDLASAKRAVFELDVTEMGGAAGDVLDVYVDALAPDGTTWLNAIHFPQLAGNAAAAKYVAILDPSNPGTSTIDVTADAAAGDVRPAVFGTQYRGRYTLVDAGAHSQSATFALTGLLQ